MLNLRSSLCLALLVSVATTTACVDSDAPPADPTADDVDALARIHPQRALIGQEGPLGEFVYEGLARTWLRWAMALPWSTGPINDTTGASCGLGQIGPVWFLAGTSDGTATRSCNLPAGRALFFPLINDWAIPPTELVDEPAELADFLAFGAEYFPERRTLTCGLTLRLDGHDVAGDTAALDQQLWVLILDPFAIWFNADNFTGGPGGFRPAALESGHFALLRPLSPGNHTLELGGRQCDGPDVFFETRVTYHLHVH